MATISVEHLTFSYPGGEDVFSDVSVQLETGWRLGLVGRNGRGKTTFLRLLLGELPHGGSIAVPVPLAYFPRPVADRAQLTGTLLRSLCPEAEDWMVERELGRLAADPAVLERPFGTLSGGEQTKALLAALFLREGCFPLIDEPTNHLDDRGRAQVAAYLRRQRGFLLVSHDRRFLDGCVDHILALNRTGFELQSGNFSSWQENFDRRQQFELARNERLREAARRTAVWSDRKEREKSGAADKGFVGHRAAKVMKRAKSLEARRQAAAEEKAGLLRDLETAEALKLHPLDYRADILAVLTDAAPCYGGRPVCAPVTFTLRRGGRVALSGPNGSGKSSLLRLLAGEPVAHTGTVTTGSGLTISYVPQETAGLRGALTDYAEACGVDGTLFRAILRKLDFSRDDFTTDLADLSAGQKKKLLARSLCQQAHLYVWDEPLNYIDVYSRLQIETLIREFAPTMVFVEHDAAFREAVATACVRLEPPEFPAKDCISPADVV